MAVVYWIHLPEHTDVFSEGYVGVTSKTIEERYSQHKKAAKNTKRTSYIVHNAIRKYKDALIIETLIEASETYCYSIENKLRADKGIGWNTAIGGSKPPSGIGRKQSEYVKRQLSKANKGRKLTLEHRLKLSEARTGLKQDPTVTKKIADANRGRKHPPRTKEALERMSVSHLGIQAKWRHPMAKERVWIAAMYIYDAFMSHNMCSYKKLPLFINYTASEVTSLYRYFKKGWIPHQDKEYEAWLALKINEITEELCRTI